VRQDLDSARANLALARQGGYSAALALNEEGYGHYVAGRRAEAVAKFREALGQFEALPLTLADLPETKWHTSQSCLLLGLARRTEHPAVAVAQLRRAVRLREQVVEALPDRPGMRAWLAVARQQLAWLLLLCPDEGVRDPAEALTLALAATEAEPAN